ncbi:MAG: hypothetical protein ABIQ30_01455 [Devosia sp.]
MPKTATPPLSKARKSRTFAFSTTAIVSFSLTLLGGSVAVLSGLLPLNTLNFGERMDVGTMLFIAPVLALTLGVIFEATRIALTRAELPEPRRRQTVSWSPGRGEG